MSLELYERNIPLYAAWKRRGADKCLRWVPAESGSVPNGAIEVGRLGGRGGEPIFIGRVNLPNGDTIPGTIIPSREACYAPWKGREVEANDYEVLVNTNPSECYLHWANLPADGSIPLEAVKGGLDYETDTLIYIVRSRPPSHHLGVGGSSCFGTHVGQLRDGETVARMSFDGIEHEIQHSFRILCRKFLHAYTNNYRPFTC